MKNILTILMLSLCATFIACSDGDDDSYNPDTAESVYKPFAGRKVSALKTTRTVNGRKYSWEHKFTYDAKGRISKINSNIQDHIKREGKYYLCNRISNACYYYKGNELEVEYAISWNFPENMMMNISNEGKDHGIFNSSGFLKTFRSVEIGVSSDFTYNGKTLVESNCDGEFVYELNRTNGNVLGYRLSKEGEVKEDCYSYYKYSATFRNNINMDLSAYFGYWGVEEKIYANASPFYAAYQLAAFGMLGTTSPNLPKSAYNEETKSYEDGDWDFDEKGYPVSYKDPFGRVTEIIYAD